MSDVIIVALISGVVTTIGAVFTVLFVSRKQANAAEIQARADAKKAQLDSVARDAEIEKLKDDVTTNVINRAREENARLSGRIEALETQALEKDIQLTALRTTQIEHTRTINAQRDQIVSLMEQLTSRDKMISSMKIEMQRQSDLIRELQSENADQREQIELMKKQDSPE